LTGFWDRKVVGLCLIAYCYSVIVYLGRINVIRYRMSVWLKKRRGLVIEDLVDGPSPAFALALISRKEIKLNVLMGTC